MGDPKDCTENTDALQLVREGTDQDGRHLEALAPEYAPADERGPAHRLVFAQAYAALVQYYTTENKLDGNWTAFFGRDVSVLLAAPAIENVDVYKASVQAWTGYLNDRENQAEEDKLRFHFGLLFGSVGTLALRLDELQNALPEGMGLRGTLRNLIATQMAPALGRLIGYHKAAVAKTLVTPAAPPIAIFRQPGVTFEKVLAGGLSKHWTAGTAWAAWVAAIPAEASIFGTEPGVFAQINHAATHTLFKGAFEPFLKGYARTVAEAAAAFETSLTGDDTHEPHYALYLAMVRLLEYARAAQNQMTGRHLDFYYRTILGMKEKAASPGHAHLVAELARQVESYRIEAGTVFRAGKDAAGRDAVFASEGELVANRARIAEQRTVYRHGDELVGGSGAHQGRLFASSVANSGDGMGGPIETADQSWHPFANRIYAEGALAEIRMPKARIGFGVASHALRLGEGVRNVTVTLTVGGYAGPVSGTDFRPDVECLLTTEKGWLPVTAKTFRPDSATRWQLVLELDGEAPAIVPYAAATHGYAFPTANPVLLVMLAQDDARPYGYAAWENVTVSAVQVAVSVQGVRSVAASNDVGALDTSKAFQPFGFAPAAGSTLVVGAAEVFQKKLTSVTVHLPWQATPAIFPVGTALPTVSFDFLKAAAWVGTSNAAASVGNTTFSLTKDLDKGYVDAPDARETEFFSAQARHGFVRLRLSKDFGQASYQTALIKYLLKEANAKDPGPTPPGGPVATGLWLDYAAEATIALNSATAANYDGRQGQFLHVTAFGSAEQHPYLLASQEVRLVPPLEFEREGATVASEAEYYLGVTGLTPPQSLAVLFQVVDGTANPLATKPRPHLAWSYLRGNEWVPFATNEVQDSSGEWTNSGIVTLAVPREASSDNTAMPTGMHWIRAAVGERSDAVCRFQLAAAQALRAAFTDRGNAPDFSATPLPAGTISKLETPDARVKSIAQPFPSFGGRGVEQGAAFYTRASERLRHKNRAIALWDYERLILEAFPQIYKVKCLNHTWYEPSDNGTGIYRELAPGHVTVVTIPDLENQNQRDPLKPYTSLGLLQEIEGFLRKRTSAFARLHVRNPQFEEVRVRFAVRLFDGFDETYYTNLLKESITRFLSPWAFAGTGSPTFGGSVYKSALVNFVEDQPYVDYVTDFEMFQDIGGVTGTTDLEAATGSRAVSVLVSAPAGRHAITVIKPEQDAEAGELCGCKI